VVILIAILISFLAVKSRRSKALFVFILVALVSLVTGLRGYGVGIDTSAYINDIFIPLSNGYFDSVYGEVGFKYFSKLILFLSKNNYTFIFLVFAVITHGLIIIRFWEERETINFPFAIFLYLTNFLALSMNILAQMFAISLIFYATRFLLKKKYLIFISFVILSMTFHTSAVVGFAIFIIFFLYNHKLRVKHFLYLIFISPIFIYIIIKYLIDSTRFLSYFDSYLVNIKFDLGLMVPIKIAVITIAFILIYLYGHKKNSYKVKKTNILIINYFNYLLGLFLQSLGYLFLFLGRISLLFLLFEPMVIAHKYKSFKGRLVLSVIYILLSIYTFALELITNGNGIVPFYLFIR